MIVDVPMSAALAKMVLTVRVFGRRRARARISLGTCLLRIAAAVIGTKIDIDLVGIDENPSSAHESCAVTHEMGGLTLD